MSNKIQQFNNTRAEFKRVLKRYADKFSDGDAENTEDEIVFAVINQARRGDLNAYKLVQPFIMPSPDSAEIWLPELSTAETPEEMMTCIRKAVATGTINTNVAEKLSALVQREQAVVDVSVIMERLERLEENLVSEKGATGLGATRFAS